MKNTLLSFTLTLALAASAYGQYTIDVVSNPGGAFENLVLSFLETISVKKVLVLFQLYWTLFMTRDSFIITRSSNWSIEVFVQIEWAENQISLSGLVLNLNFNHSYSDLSLWNVQIQSILGTLNLDNSASANAGALQLIFNSLLHQGIVISTIYAFWSTYIP